MNNKNNWWDYGFYSGDDIVFPCLKCGRPLESIVCHYCLCEENAKSFIDGFDKDKNW